MPEKDKLSWLTPKRRKTTGSVKTISHGQMRTVAEQDESQAAELDASLPEPASLSAQRSIQASKEHGRDDNDTAVQLAQMLRLTEMNADSVSRLASRMGNNQHDHGGYFDTSALAVHFGRMTDLLARNIEHMESMAQKQSEHEQRLTAALEDISTKRKEDRIDLAQLSAHLDRVNKTLDRSPTPRKDSVRLAADDSRPSIDFSPLVWRLEQMQHAIEQNNALTAQLLEERSTADAEARYKNQLDLLPISESLEKIYGAVEKQNLHTNALLEILRDDKDDSLQTAKANGETLDRILQAQMETKEAVEHNGGDVDFEPVARHMDAIREVATENTEQIRILVECQKDHNQSKSIGRPESLNLDFSPMTDRLDRVHATLEKSTSHLQTQTPGTGDMKFLMSALASHLSKIQAVTDQNANAIKTVASNQAHPNLAPQVSSSNDRTHEAIRETNDRLQALTKALTERELDAPPVGKVQDKLARHLEETSSQVQDLMAAQRETFDVVRELAMSIRREKRICDHIVTPPPRKVGRKILGYVYDGSEAVR